MTPDFKDPSIASYGAAVLVALMLLFQLLGVDLNALFTENKHEITEDRLTRIYQIIETDRNKLDDMQRAQDVRIASLERVSAIIADRDARQSAIIDEVADDLKSVNTQLQAISVTLSVIDERIKNSSKTK